MPRRHEVYAYITRVDQLLVFRHVDFPAAGNQVPGGMMEAGETPEIAVKREAGEETGLQGLVLKKNLGSDEYHISSTQPEEIRLRYFFHLRCLQYVLENWQHHERQRSDGSPGPILFDFYCLPLAEAGRVLHPYFIAKQDRLAGSIAGISTGRNSSV